jgi:hypothetical protein
MKSYAYYRTTSISIPKKDDYMTIYYYRKGVMIGMKSQFDEEFEPPKNCVEERVLDEVSFNAHMRIYQDENLRLQEEFREDLIAKYEMTGHPNANKVFNKAWDMGCAGGLEEVEYYFCDLIELFQDKQSNIAIDPFSIIFV